MLNKKLDTLKKEWYSKKITHYTFWKALYNLARLEVRQMKTIGIRLTIISLSVIVIGLMFVGLSLGEIDEEAIMGMWLFDDGKGDTAKDSSLNGNDGTLMNAPKWGSGKFGKAVEFDGKDDYVEVPNTFSLTDVSFSITAWVNVMAVKDDMGVVNRGDQTADTNIHLHCNIRSMKPHFGFYGNDLGGVTTLSAGKWYFISWVYDKPKNVRQIYVNGVVDSQDKPPSAYKADHPLWIGIYYDLARVFSGLIDEVAIFNVALTEADIKTIMTKGLEGLSAVSPSGKLTKIWGDIKQQ